MNLLEGSGNTSEYVKELGLVLPHLQQHRISVQEKVFSSRHTIVVATTKDTTKKSNLACPRKTLTHKPKYMNDKLEGQGRYTPNAVQ